MATAHPNHRDLIGPLGREAARVTRALDRVSAEHREVFKRQAVASTEIGARFEPVVEGAGVRMNMYVLGRRFSCLYGQGGDQPIESLAMQLDALCDAGHPQAELLQVWFRAWETGRSAYDLLAK